MKKNDPQASTASTLPELAAELEATKKKLARTERKLERETATARLWFNTLDETKQELARTRAELARTRALLDRAQDVTERALNRADRIQDIADYILGIDTRGKSQQKKPQNGEESPRHRRRWQLWRHRRK